MPPSILPRNQRGVRGRVPRMRGCAIAWVRKRDKVMGSSLIFRDYGGTRTISIGRWRILGCLVKRGYNWSCPILTAELDKVRRADYLEKRCRLAEDRA